MSEQKAIPISIYRCGTSKGIFIEKKHMPKDQSAKTKVLLDLLGNPDSSQIDGIGGGNILTSKVGIISKSSKKNIDLEYEFAQIQIGKNFVDYAGNCGNVSSGVAAYAIDEKIIECSDGKHTISIFNKNTKKILYCTLDVLNGEAKILGNCKIAGVNTRGYAPVIMDYKDTVGAKTGLCLPTGNLIDYIKLSNGHKVPVSITDVGNPVIHVLAEDFNICGNELPKQLEKAELLNLYQEIKAKCAELIGQTKNWKTYSIDNFIPFLAIVGLSRDYKSIDNKLIKRNTVNFLSRLFLQQFCHTSYPMTGACATAVCAVIPGTIVNHVLNKKEFKNNEITIGHPSGELTVNVDGKNLENVMQIQFNHISFVRTVRKLMCGNAFIPQ